MERDESYWFMIWKEFYGRKLGRVSFFVIIFFCLLGIYAPFFASSKPLVVQYDGQWFFPLFRYLFYRGFYTKGLDIFFNLLIFTFPIAIGLFYTFFYRSKTLIVSLLILFSLHICFFIFFFSGPSKDPAFDSLLSQGKQKFILKPSSRNWKQDLQFMSPYARLNLALRYQQRLRQQKCIEKYIALHPHDSISLSTLWEIDRQNEENEITRLKKIIKLERENDLIYEETNEALNYLQERHEWLESQLPLLKYEIMPLIRPFHWEDDAGGSQALNHIVSFWELTRINRKDLVAALIFGTRVSLVVGVLAVALALGIGLPIGALAGFYGGIFDIIVSRLLEIWEAMPTFFMLLMIIAILQNKSTFLVIAIIGLFGWTTFSRYIRGEFFKQRNLPYIEACHAIGLPNRLIIFSHILPNAIPPVLTLLPFAIMGAITSEAGLSFLGLGEEGSCSWGVLMDEGRSAFPSESYLLWPPAILLTILLIAIALVGDSFRDALDPKMRK